MANRYGDLASADLSTRLFAVAAEIRNGILKKKENYFLFQVITLLQFCVQIEKKKIAPSNEVKVNPQMTVCSSHSDE